MFNFEYSTIASDGRRPGRQTGSISYRGVGFATCLNRWCLHPGYMGEQYSVAIRPAR